MAERQRLGHILAADGGGDNRPTEEQHPMVEEHLAGWRTVADIL
jgi:hypothetical protein